MSEATLTQQEEQLSELSKTVTGLPFIINTPIQFLDIATTDLSMLRVQAESQPYFIADDAYKVTGIHLLHSKAQGSADGCALNVLKYTGTTALGASETILIPGAAYTGEDLTYRGFNLKSTANTVQDATLTTARESVTLAAGDRLVWGIMGTTSSTFIGLTTYLEKL